MTSERKKQIWRDWYNRHKVELREFYKEKNNKRKNEIKAYLKKIKLDKSCVRCGFSDPRALEYHHTKGNKEFEIATAINMGYSIERINKEIEKCELICANCHRIEHSQLFVP
ncbi:MAG: hypothetical protein IFNCLDLE_02623 [Ignavibacteriaceae bacterium]|nr:hypothetical protein [Ignavibacteriaceae bacterium]